MASSGSARALDAYAAAERLTGRRAKVAAREDGGRLREGTHYGPIAKVLHFGEQVVTCICPIALMWSMASASDEFGMFLVGCLEATKCPRQMASTSIAFFASGTSSSTLTTDAQHQSLPLVLMANLASVI